MKIKLNSSELLQSVGIKKKHADVLQGQHGTPTGRKIGKAVQLEFDGSLIGWKEPFVYFVPAEAIEND